MRIFLALLLLTASALAQQPQQPTPVEVANNVAQTVLSMGQVITNLQQQLAAVTKERDELKAQLSKEHPPEKK